MKTRILPTARLSISLATAIAALLAVPSARALDGTWLGTTGDWTNAGTWTGGTIADGIGFTANFTDVDIFADEVITLAADRTIGNITFTDAATPSNNLLITGANLLTLDVASGAPTINVTQSGRTLTIDSVIAGSDGLRKTGAGALTLNGSSVNTFTGDLAINGGTLTLDSNNLASPTNLVDATNALQINNGALTITGKATGTTAQTFASTTLGAGRNTLNISRNGASGSATLNLGALTVDPGSITVINPATVWATGVPSTTEKVFTTGVNGNPLPGVGKVNVNAALFYRQSASAGAARWVSVDSAGQLQALPATIAILTAATVPDPINAYQISSANITLTNTAMAIYGLVLNGNSNPRTLTLAANGTLTLNGILGVQSTNQTNIVPGTGTSHLIIGPEKNLVINLDNSAPLSITAPIVNNGGGASAVTIASTIPSGTPGSVTFGGANSYTGATTISNGTLILSNVGALGGSNPGVNATSAISMASGTRLAPTLTGVVINAPITVGATGTTVTISAPNVGSQAFTAGVLTLGGAIGGAGNVTFNSTQAVNNLNNILLTAQSTYAGSTLMDTTATAAGGSTSTGSHQIVVRLGIDDALPTSTVLTIDGKGGTGTGRVAEFVMNGFDQTLAGLNNVTRNLRVQRVVNSDVSAASTLTINGSVDSTYGGTIGVNSAANSMNVSNFPGGTNGNNVLLVKNGSGTFALTGSNPFSGKTTVLGGILSLGNASALLQSPLDTAGSIAGDPTNGLRTTVTTLTLGGLTGNKDFADVFETTSGGYSGLTALTLNPVSGTTHTYSADIGDGATGMNLIKTGAGTQILAAAQSYTGTTTGSAGALIAATTAALPGYNVADKVIFNGGTIGVQVGGGGWTTGEVDTLLTNATKTSGALGIDTTNGNLVQWTPFTPTNFGSLGLNKLGANDLTLNQANTFTGITTVTEGTLTLSNALALQNSPLVTTGAGTVSLGSGTILNLGGLSGATGDLAAVVSNYSTVTAINLNTPATLPGAGLSYGGVISDGVPGTTLTKNGPGVQALSGANSYTGATQINDGILVFRTMAAKTGATATAAAAGSIGLGVKDADAAFYSAADVDALFNTNTLTGFVLDPASGVAIDTNAASFDQTIALTAARSLTKLGGNTLTLSQANTYNGATIVNNGTLSLTGSLDGGGAISTIGTSVFSQTSTGVISGAATFTQGSTGTSSLAGANTYTGVTNINSGQLAISNATALGTTDGNTVVASGGRLTMATASLSVAEPLTITGTGTTATNGAISFGGGVTGMELTGPITVGGDARIQADGNTGSTLSGGISLGGNVLTINADGGATQTINTTAITGSGGSLVKSGGGTLVLGSANTYTGSTTVNLGTLSITDNDALGTTAGATTINGGNGTNSVFLNLSAATSDLTIAEPINLFGNPAGRARLNNNSAQNHTLSGPIDVSSDTNLAHIWSDGTGSITVTGDITGTMTNGALLFVRGASTSEFNRLLGNINIIGNLAKTEGGTWLVGAPGKTYSWADTIAAVGTLKMGIANVLPSATVVTMGNSTGGSTGTLDLNGHNQTVGGITYSGQGVATGTRTITSATPAVLTVNNATDFINTGTNTGTNNVVLTGALSLTKQGAGILALNGVNTYSGDTTVNEGTLSLTNADSALDANTGNGGSTVTIAATASATLDLAYTGTDEVDKLFIGGVQKSPGVWGSNISGAPNTDPKLTGTGTLTVANGPAANNYASWAALQVPPITGGPNGDDDLDGVKNLVEYALADGQERGALTGTSLSFTKRGAPYGGDLNYEIETSENLGISDPWGVVTPTVNNATTISYTLQNPGDNFARLKVTQVP